MEAEIHTAFDIGHTIWVVSGKNIRDGDTIRGICVPRQITIKIIDIEATYTSEGNIETEVWYSHGGEMRYEQQICFASEAEAVMACEERNAR